MESMSSAEIFLRKANRQMERLMPVLTPSGVLIGLLLFPFFKPLKPLVTWLFAFLTLVNGMGVSIADFRKVLRHPASLAVFMISAYLLLPVLSTSIAGLLFSSDPETVLGFTILYAIPTAVSGCVWSGIYGGNGALSIAMLVIGTVLAPAATPLTVRILAGSDIEIDSQGMMLSLLGMVVIPSLLGIAINWITKGRCTEHAVPSLKPLTKLSLLLVVMINTSQIAESLIAEASWAYIPDFLTAFAFTISGFVIARLLSAAFRLSMPDTIAVTFASGMRNISAAMVIAISFFPPRSVLPVIAGIVMQQSACAIAAPFLFRRNEGKRNMPS